MTVPGGGDMQSVPQSSSAGGGPERPPLLLDSFAELELPAHWSVCIHALLHMKSSPPSTYTYNWDLSIRTLVS